MLKKKEYYKYICPKCLNTTVLFISSANCICRKDGTQMIPKKCTYPETIK